MPKISVLMSVYNENEKELMQSVHSILNQTYPEFEFIIVCDNPSDKRLSELLDQIQKLDSRIILVRNERNMGLAMSLNHGYEYASGDYIARMDADDISEPQRLKKQIDFMEKTDCDLVWSSYQYMNETGELLNHPVDFYEKDEIIRILPLKNIIHHPTVLMKKTAFEEAGKYRDFPCAQDYDLWLRMLSGGLKMEMMEDILLKYRVRQTSTTNRKKFQQICTLNYIRSLYMERCRFGGDSYSYENYLSCMNQCGVGDQKRENSFLEAKRLIDEAKKCCKKHRYLFASVKTVHALILSDLYRNQLFLIVKRKLMKKQYKKSQDVVR